MKKLITILTLILFITLLAISQDKYVEWAKEIGEITVVTGDVDFYKLIVERANREWDDDYSMVAYEIKRQCKALHDYLVIKTPIGMTENTLRAIQATAMGKWGEVDISKKPIKLIGVDWVMVLYETKK